MIPGIIASAIKVATGGGGGDIDLFEAFEGTGTPTDWTLYGGTFDHEGLVYSGSNSFYPSNSGASVIYAEWNPSEISGGVQVDYVEVHYYDGASGNGGGFCIVDSNGDDVIGFASSNPDWEIWDGDGWSRAPNGSGEHEWTRIRFVFDWGAGTCDIECENLESEPGIIYTQSARPLINNTDVESIECRSFGSTSRGWNSGESTETRYDDISIFKGTILDLEEWSRVLKHDDITVSLDGLIQGKDASSGSWKSGISMNFHNSGKVYWEIEYIDPNSDNRASVGIATALLNLGNYLGSDGNGYGWLGTNGDIRNNGSDQSNYGAGLYANGDVLMFAFDVDNGDLWVGVNGTWSGTGDPDNLANPVVSGISTTENWHIAASQRDTGETFTIRSHSNNLNYTPPTGFTAWAET